MKPCDVCAVEFEPQRMGQKVCSPKCAVKVPKLARKEKRAELSRRKEAVKSRGKWMAEAQHAFNAWIRRRDAGDGCISCGTHEGKRNAGHWLSTGARPELRFDPANVHGQCERCNTYLHGNLVMYRLALLQKIGPLELARLEGPQPVVKLTIPDLRAIRDDYRNRLRFST